MAKLDLFHEPRNRVKPTLAWTARSAAAQSVNSQYRKLRVGFMDLVRKDRIDDWIAEIVETKSFVDIGGIGDSSINERVSFAAAAGASRVAMADIVSFDHHLWGALDSKLHQVGSGAIAQRLERYDQIDLRSRDSLAKLGVFDVVHCTGIFYHLPSPADALMSLRSIVGEHLIINTVTFPGHVSNEFGSVTLPDSGVLFLAALSEAERKILGKFYGDKFGIDLNGMAPRPDDRSVPNQWVEGGQLTCWPNWFFYSDNAFRSLIKLCRLEIVDEYKWEDHALQILCRPIE